MWARRKIDKREIKTKVNPNQRKSKTRRESKRGEINERKLCFLLFIASIALNPSFSDCDAERNADKDDGETFTQRNGEGQTSHEIILLINRLEIRQIITENNR